MNAQELKTKSILESLPHGSGIDCDWTTKERKNGNLEFSNSFHRMDEMGGYDGWQDFTVIFYRHKADRLNDLSGPLDGCVQIVHRKGDWDFRVEFNGPVSKRNSAYGLKDYLEETLAQCLDSHYIGVRSDILQKRTSQDH